MTTPSDVPPVQPIPVHPAQQEAEKVEKVARRFVRARSAVSNTLKHYVAPVAAGTLVGVLANRRNRTEKQDSSETTTPVDYDNE